MRRPRLAHIPPGPPFLDTLARHWLDENAADPSDGLILLPTRRAARSLADAFLRVGGGRPMLLPRITAIGAIDETPLALAGALDLPQAVPEMERCAVLARLVVAALGLPADRAWALARELASLMDEAERAEVPLAVALTQAVAEEYAQHWQLTLSFLTIVTEHWPAWLAEQDLMNPAAREVALLRGQSRAWLESPPALAVWAAGFAGGSPSVAALLRTIAALPSGLVVFPWLAPQPEGDETHPQFGLAALLAAMDARPGEAEAWGVESARATLLGRALLPAAALGAWDARPPASEALLRLDPADAQEEAASIAMILRDAVERDGRQAALVTPDRALALRVSTELLRWGIVADDSAGEALADTPPAVFLRLLALAVAEDLAPVALLSLLKHPLAAAGLSPAACREAARTLERAVLRGPKPPPGFTGLRFVRESKAEPAVDIAFIERIRTCLEPLLRQVPPRAYPPVDLLAALIEAGEALAATDAETGDVRLWSGEEGEALAVRLADSLAALAHLPEQAPFVLPGLLDTLLDGQVVRTRRALRGRADASEHPLVSIWGLLEARLQTVDVVVLGGLAEGVWPPATDPGPWMSRPMRKAAGLPTADAAIGQSAHDFVMAACGAEVAILSCPVRRDGAPAVPSRWLARLDALLTGHGMALDAHPASIWARRLDLPPDGRAKAAEAPHPCPPVALRPRAFSVTDIATLIADPYAIYARKILFLKPLDPIEQETDALEIGIVVHAGLERFLREVGTTWPPDAERRLRDAMDAAAIGKGLRPALASWWAPRLARIAAWVVGAEARRRADGGDPLALSAEVQGIMDIGRFRLNARADRLEQGADGSLAILDYKTGSLPSGKEVLDGTAPQLPLEAAMAGSGAFGPSFAGPLGALTYWRLTGGRTPGEARTPLKPAELAGIADEAAERLLALLDSFDDPARPYPHHPHPSRKPRFPAYAHLARALELAAADDDDGDG